MLKNVHYLISETDPTRLGPSAGEVCFVGRSNVGKSSLINSLCGKTVARVSNTPGRTRMINVFSAGHHRWVVDLPGYGYARVPESERRKWGPMIEGYLTSRPNLRMVYCLVDAQVGPTRLDEQLHEWILSNNLPWRVVATKADQVRSTHWPRQRQVIADMFSLKPDEVIWTSARKGVGIPLLINEIAQCLAG